jgi:hypothetical protein
MKQQNLFTDKKGFLLRDVILAALFGVGLISLFVIFVGGVADNYNRNDIVSQKFADNYDNLERLTDGVEISRGSITNSSSGISLIGAFSVTFNSFFTVVQVVWTSLDVFASSSASAVSDFTFLSPLVIKILFVILLSALTIYITFVVISSVTRGRV